MATNSVPVPKVLPPASREERWNIMATTGPELPVRKSPCEDCAVVTGMYREIAEELKAIPEPTRTAAARRWWCHDSPFEACAGNMRIIKGTV